MKCIDENQNATLTFPSPLGRRCPAVRMRVRPERGNQTSQQDSSSRFARTLTPLPAGEGLKTLRLAALLAALAVTGTALAQSAGDYRLGRHVTAAGGGVSTGGANYRLHGTIGQADANTSASLGGGFRLSGGYWAAVTGDDDPGPEPGDDPIFSAGFENTGGTP